MASSSSGREWEKAKELIRGVMATVERLQSTNAPDEPNRGQQQSESALPIDQHIARGLASSLPRASLPSTSQDYASSLPSTSRERASSQPGRSAYEEHAHLFGFNPSSSCRKGKERKRKQKGGAGYAVKRAKISYWSKESICLRYTDQQKAPDTEDKMKLAQMGLGFQELKFELEGDCDDMLFSRPIQCLNYVVDTVYCALVAGQVAL